MEWRRITRIMDLDTDLSEEKKAVKTVRTPTFIEKIFKRHLLMGRSKCSAPERGSRCPMHVEDTVTVGNAIAASDNDAWRGVKCCVSRSCAVAEVSVIGDRGAMLRHE